MGDRDGTDRKVGGMNSWRAGCVETRTSGSEGGLRKRTGRKTDTAPQPDPYKTGPAGGRLRRTSPAGNGTAGLADDSKSAVEDNLLSGERTLPSHFLHDPVFAGLHRGNLQPE